ncbi:MAG: SDR family oxidoreductase [Chloroflexi bacterium]|nr:SDR family oxidoreductase [Chloroflexota bacterium]
MAGTFEDQVALVTGASSGIGRATALKFASLGASVMVADTNVEGGEETVSAIKEAGGEASFVHVNVAQASGAEEMVARTIETYGRLDCAFNNAGIASSRGAASASGRRLTHEVSEDDWDRIINVNLKGVWLSMKHEIPQMLEQGKGTIVNTASVAGLVGLNGGSSYVASKHGVVGLTKTAALEYAQQGIRVNCVCPGYIETPMTAGLLADPVTSASVISREPIGRVGAPREIAEAVTWLSSDAASFVTGHAMAVDGGYTAQ